MNDPIDHEDDTDPRSRSAARYRWARLACLARASVAFERARAQAARHHAGAEGPTLDHALRRAYAAGCADEAVRIAMGGGLCL